MEDARVELDRAVDARRREPAPVREALVPQHVAVGEDDERAREPRQVGARSGETCGWAGSPPYWSQYQAMCAAVWK